MFGFVGNFLYRHRRKFLFTGITVGGLALFSKYAEHRLIKWQEESTRKLLQQQRRKTHFDRTLNSTRVMLLELMPTIRKIIEKELNTESIVEAIKQQPANKRQLWKELVPLGFGRTICSIVTMAFATPVAHAVMMVLSAHTLVDEEEKDPSRMASPEVQAQYLACFKNLIEEQISVLVSRVMKVVSESIGDISLTKEISLPVLESILQQATLAVTSDKVGYCSSQGAAFIPPTVLPWSQYLKSPEPLYGKPDASRLLRDMYLTTQDILSTDDFSDVVNILIQVGVNYVLDEFADNMMYVKPVSEAIPQTLSETNIEKNVTPKVYPEDNSETFSSDGIKGKSKISHDSDSKLDSNSISNPDSYQQFDINKVSVVLVKIVPILSGMIHNILPDSTKVNLVLDGAPGSGYYNRLVVCSQLEALSFNIYDALMVNSNYDSE